MGDNLDQGSAFVFASSDSAESCGVGECGVWSEQQQLSARDGKAGDAFGAAVALDGNTALIGAYLDNNVPDVFLTNANQGSAYLFTRDLGGASWTDGQRLVDPVGSASDFFGAAVAIGGDTVAVGAPGVDNLTLENAGQVYTTVRGPTPWPETHTIAAEYGHYNEYFGYQVALDGDTALIAAPRWDSALVFIRYGDVWTEQQRLYGGRSFGESLALDGDTAIIGAPLHSIWNQGTAFVFVRSAGIWSLQQRLITSDGEFGDAFGESLALEGDTALIGASGDDVGANVDQGSVYVFTREGGVWGEKQKLTAGDGTAADYFSNDSGITLNGDTAVICANNDYVGNGARGSAYVFVRTGGSAIDGVWSEQQKLTGGEGTNGRNLDGPASLDGDTVVIGAHSEPSEFKGSAYIFVRSGGIWSKAQTLLPPEGGGDYDYFGWSVALDSDTIVVTAHTADVGGIINQGVAHVFAWNGSTWAWKQRVLPGNGVPGVGEAHVYFGNSVALDGDTALVGAPWADVDGIVNAGRVHIFQRGADVADWDYLPMLFGR